MTSIVRNLFLILLVQVALVFFLGRRHDSLASFTPNEALIKVQAAEVSKLDIEQGSSASAGASPSKLSLVKDAGIWKVADADNFPGAQAKIQTLLDKLSALKKSLPVGTSEIAAKQLKASASDFEKKLLIYQGDKAWTLYIGTSPMFKKVHVRVDGDINTYIVDLISYELLTNPSDWINKSQFAISRGVVRKVKIADVELTLDNNTPKVAGLDDRQELDVKEADSFLNELDSLKFSDLASAEQKQKINDKKPSLEISVEKGDNTIEILAFIEGDGDDRFLKSASQPYFVKISKSTFDSIQKVNKSLLIKVKSDKKEEKQAENAEKKDTGTVGSKPDASAVGAASEDSVSSVSPIVTTPEGNGEVDLSAGMSEGDAEVVDMTEIPEDGEVEAVDSSGE